MELTVYYCAYLWSCAALVAGLSWILRRSRTILVRDALAGKAVTAAAIARLLDVGFYLISGGYVALTFQTALPMNDGQQVFDVLIQKLGWFSLVLGAIHLFNLLLLAMFRCNSASAPATPAS